MSASVVNVNNISCLYHVYVRREAYLAAGQGSDPNSIGEAACNVVRAGAGSFLSTPIAREWSQEYLIHEGEPTPFFAVMEGTTEVLKEVHPRRTGGPYLSERQWGTVREDYSIRPWTVYLLARAEWRGKQEFA